MTRMRLMTGFHRLGLILMVPFIAAALVPLSILVFERPADPSLAIVYAVLLVLAGALAYGACRAVAWIAGGFMGQ